MPVLCHSVDCLWFACYIESVLYTIDKLVNARLLGGSAMHVCARRTCLISAILPLLLLLAIIPAFSSVVCYLDGAGAPYGVSMPDISTSTDAVAALAYPPTGYRSAIPAGTKLLSFMIEPDATIVDFSKEIVSGGIDEARFELVCEQVRNTVQQFGLSASVRITVDGTPLYKFLPPDPVVEPAHEAQIQSPPTPSVIGLGGKKISLSPGHGLFWLGTYWANERPLTCSPLLREDDHNDEIIRYLDTYLRQDGAATKVYRCIDKNAGNYSTGTPWWQMNSSYWLKNIGYPCSVYASSSGDCTLGTGSSESSDNIMARPVASDYDNANCHISLHSNALSGDCFGSSCPNGTVTYYDNSSSHTAYGAISQSLAQSVQSSLIDAIRTKYSDSTWRDRGALDSDGAFAETRVPDRAAILIELAFHDSCDRDGLYLQDTFFRSTTMWAVYKGVCDYFSVTPTWDYYSYEVVSEDIPSTMRPGSSRDVQITLRNRGVLWNEAHQIRLGAVDNSDPFTPTGRYTVSGDVEASQTVTFNLHLTAPTTPGTYTTDWRMVREYVTWFGPTIQKNIVVAEPTGDPEPPTAPTNLVATAVGMNQINLSWTASTDNIGVVGYNVYRGGALITTTSSTTYQSTGLTSNTAYSYQVSAFDPSNNESAKSNTANATTFPRTEYILDNADGVQVSSWVTGTAASSYGSDYLWGSSTVSNSRSVTWTPNIEVAGTYSVYAWWVSSTNRATAAPYTVGYNGGSVTVPVNQQANGGAWNLITSGKSFLAGTSGYIRLDSGTGATGSVLVADAVRFVCTAIQDSQAPSIPTNLTATPTSSSQINLSWTASTDNVGVTGYKIYRGGSLLTTTTATSYQNTGLSPNTAYSYQVSAYDAGNNESAKGNIANATTQPSADQTPPAISITNVTPSMTAAGYQMKVTVVATDNVGVTSVTAAGNALAKGPGNSWFMYINADVVPGTHLLPIIVKDAAGNQVTNSTTSYITAPVYGVSSRALLTQGPAQAAASKYVYKIWGTVTPIDKDHFDLNDGSNVDVRVYCTDHCLTIGQFAIVFGVWDRTTNPAQLKTQTSQVQTLN